MSCRWRRSKRKCLLLHFVEKRFENNNKIIAAYKCMFLSYTYRSICRQISLFLVKDILSFSKKDFNFFCFKFFNKLQKYSIVKYISYGIWNGILLLLTFTKILKFVLKAFYFYRNYQTLLFYVYFLQIYLLSGKKWYLTL